MDAIEAVRVVTHDYQREASGILVEHGDLVRTLVAEIETHGGLDAIVDFVDDVIDGMKGDLGTRAANMTADEDDEAIALGEAERWIASNVANAGTAANVLCAIIWHGSQAAAEDIRAALDMRQVTRVPSIGR